MFLLMGAYCYGNIAVSPVNVKARGFIKQKLCIDNIVVINFDNKDKFISVRPGNTDKVNVFVQDSLRVKKKSKERISLDVQTLTDENQIEFDLIFQEVGASLMGTSYSVKVKLDLELLREYIIKPNDCLSRIAALPEVYGDEAMWVNLFEENKGNKKAIKDPDMIYPYRKLIIKRKD